MKLFLIGTKRAGGDVILVGPEASPSEQKATLETMYAQGSKEFQTVAICEMVPRQSVQMPMPKAQPETKKMKSKSILSMLVITAALLLPLTASAQIGPQTIAGLTGGTNNVAATATNSYSTEFHLPSAQNVSLMFEFKMGAANSANIDFVLTPTDGSGNASTLEADKVINRVAANGTTVQRAIFKVDTGGIVAYTLAIRNTNAAAANLFVTNIVAKVINKDDGI